MSASHEKESWIETWWPVLVISFGATMAAILAATAATVRGL